MILCQCDKTHAELKSVFIAITETVIIFSVGSHLVYAAQGTSFLSVLYPQPNLAAVDTGRNIKNP